MQGRCMTCVVDLGQIRENMRIIRSHVAVHAGVLAVVKADAYGHGLVPVARTTLAAGADGLAVAVPEEGELLRQHGIQAPVLVLGHATEAAAGDCVSLDLTQTVATPETVFAIERAARLLHRQAEVHLALDTGMGRIGCRDEDEVRAVLHAIDGSPHVKLTGVYTHFADADGRDAAYTEKQFAAFMRMSALCPGQPLRHCANSAAIHRFPNMAMDTVRAGISLYGYPPVASDWPLKPCLSWYTEVTYVKTVEAGESISYGRTYTTTRPMRIATVACGYGDGYHRAASGRAEVLIHGRRAPVLGRICMDQMMVDVSAVPEVQPGDKVTLIGEDGDERITAEELANWAGTIAYEVLLAPTARVERRWIGDGDEPHG